VITLDDGRASDRDLLDVFRKHDVRPTIFLTSGLIGTRRAFWTSIPASHSQTEHLKRVPDSERVATLEALGHTDTTEYSSPSALSRSDIEEMRGDVDFQAHTVFHAILSQCSDERSKREIVDCRRQLEDGFGLDIYAFAYPNGRSGFFLDRDVDNVREAGYSCAVTVDPGTAGSGSDIFRLPRYTVSEDASTSEVLVRASGIAHALKRLVRR
jgi:poly-beta-1,6-N-acetyl-D-glucosamine N-deacetylase